MVFEELLEHFLYSRRHGTSGARGNARERTIDNYDKFLRPFFTFLQQKRSKSKYEELTRLDIRAYVEAINSNKNWSEATKLAYLRVVRALLKFVEKDEDCRNEGLKPLSQFLPAIAQTPRRTIIPTTVDLKKWRNAFDTSMVFGYRDYVVYCLIMVTGLRIGEVCWMRLEHMQLDARLIYVPMEGKTGSRLVAITKEMVALLKGWLKRRDIVKRRTSPYVFVSKYSDRCTVSAFDQRFRRMRLKHGLSYVTPHTVRHAFSTYFLRNGGNIEQLRNTLGHTSYDTVKVYLHLAEVGSDAAKDVLEKASPLKMLNEKVKV